MVNGYLLFSKEKLDYDLLYDTGKNEKQLKKFQLYAIIN